MGLDSRAEELFAQFLARRDEDGTASLEELRRAHPELAEDLAALERRWLEFEPRYARLRDAEREPDLAAALLARLAGRRAGGERFESRAEIGRGGMGRVVCVFDPDLERELALKVAHEEDAADGSLARRRRARFLAEARITGGLQHPGIVPIHEIGLDREGRLFYTMPLIEGEDLERVFERVLAHEPGWSTARALSYLLRVCETMAYAHSRGVVHGDLKPANVRIGRFGEVYVMDWGLARLVGAPAPAPVPEAGAEAAAFSELLSAHSRVLGTPAYLAPEQVRAPRPGPDPRADVYAVGAMLYRLLAGRLPNEERLRGVRDVETLRAVLAMPPEPLERVAASAAPELVSIAARAMALDPARRYPDMGSLADDLRAFLEGRVVSAHATGPLVELRKWIARNRLSATALAAFVASLLVGLFVSARLYESASAERDRVLRLSDARHLDQLAAEAEGLWPARPERLGDLDAWLAEGHALLERLPAHRQTLAELRRGARTQDGRWRLAGTEEQWHHDTLEALVARLEDFAAPERGLLAVVQRRRDFASTVEERSRGAPAARAAWEQARRSIADRAQCPAYDGLELAPQLGLLPLGRDPASGLWEFAHLQSGDPPVRGPDGRLRLEPASGIVLVLIPGGSFRMGAQAAERDGEHYFAGAFANEGPVHTVALRPYFLAKHELTQGQWLRATGSNPSSIAWGSSGAQALGWTREESLLHPVETVSRSQCAQMLATLDLELPTEAQWERAARAGTETPWWTGDTVVSLQGAANLADQAVVRAGGEWPQIERELDDGYYRHAPVDALASNPFGLHHVLGNVWEWCRDDFASYDLPARAGDGLRLGPGGGQAVGRGGGYVNNAAYARSSLRDARPDAPHLLFGARPARVLEP